MLVSHFKATAGESPLEMIEWVDLDSLGFFERGKRVFAWGTTVLFVLFLQ